MLFSATAVRRLVVGALGAGAVSGGMLVGALPSASAQPAPPPPNCTAADFSGVASGVSAASSAYLFTHPDVNTFLTGLHGMPHEQIRTEVANYLEMHPQVNAELRGIRQPLADIKHRCGFTPDDPDGPNFP
ncbi:heme-binding protein [Mycolicibacterium austroafricanum]|uniref:heme-binding protein n=1 Tax=Mycolicibacterium austroafricanum TaxID=39687 RepID=UPI0005622F60|nr:heme-binding protein [Mycolicibacterium austroafricanum]QZY46510.1 heme-binding protein [Mycolicibacterium austroafricanum]